jgi:hypothetical protein
MPARDDGHVRSAVPCFGCYDSEGLVFSLKPFTIGIVFYIKFCCSLCFFHPAEQHHNIDFFIVSAYQAPELFFDQDVLRAITLGKSVKQQTLRP